MNSILATEVTPQPEEKPAALPPLEAWATNERMRHIPSLEWMIRKIDVDVRKRLEILLSPVGSLENGDPRRPPIEEEGRHIVRALDRLAEIAKHSRPSHQPADLTQRVQSSLNHAVANLRVVDAHLFGRRFPYNAFERSKSEPIYGALLTVLTATDRLIPLIRQIDARLDERLLDGLVVLQNPVDERMLRPIA